MEARCNLAIAILSVLLVKELSPESQKTRVAILIADGAPISRWPGFFAGGGLPRPLPVDDQIDLRFTTIQCDSR